MNVSAANPRILITGGAGFLGINLIRFLLDQGFTRIRSLDIANFDYPERKQIDAVHGDIRCRELVNHVVSDVDWIVHAAAALPLYTTEDIFSTDVQGTDNLLNAAHNFGIRRFIHISSTAVYGIPDHSPILETEPLRGVGAYGAAKIEAEEACSKYRRKGLVVSVIRPKSFIGPERRGAFELLYSWASEGRNFPIIGDGSNRYQLLDVEDLCRAILLCARGDPDKANDVFNIGAAEFATLRQDFQVVLDEAGHGKRIIPFPAGIAAPALKVMAICRLSPIYTWIYKTAGKESVVSIDKARRQLGFQPRYNNQQALLRNYYWYLQNRQRLYQIAGVSHRTAWPQGILGLIKRFF